MDCSPPGWLCPWNSPGKNTVVGCHSFLQEIFLTQGWNMGLLNCRQILYHLSHQGNPRYPDVENKCMNTKGEMKVGWIGRLGFTYINYCCSVAKSFLTLCHVMDCSMHCPPLSPEVCPSSCPLNWWHHSTSPSAALFSSCPQYFPSRSFPMSWILASGGQSNGASSLASVLLISIQGAFPLGLTGLISVLSKGLLRVFSSTTVQNQFFDTLPSFW